MLPRNSTNDIKCLLIEMIVFNIISFSQLSTYFEIHVYKFLTEIKKYSGEINNLRKLNVEY